MGDSKKANEEMLNSLHHMTAERLSELLVRAKKEDDHELMLRVLREVRGFLKDNDVTAFISPSSNLPKQVEASTAVAELPFTVEDSEEE